MTIRPDPAPSETRSSEGVLGGVVGRSGTLRPAPSGAVREHRVRKGGQIGYPLLLRAVFRDTCEVFPDHRVIVVAEYANHCEVVAAHRYSALRPVVQGW